MNVKNSFVITVLFFFPGILYPNEDLGRKNILDRVLARLAQSSWVVKLNERLATYDAVQSSGGVLPPDLVKLGKDAQLDVGIPANRIVPLVQKSFGLTGPFAEAGRSSITLNNQAPDPYSVNRCNIYHEAVHIKYHDYTTKTITRLGGLIGGLVSGPVVAKLLKPQGKWKAIYPIFALGFARMGMMLSDKYYGRYIERRADIEGHYATQCHVCVHEKAQDVQSALEEAQKIVDIVPPFLKNKESSDQLSVEQRTTLENNLAYARDYIKDKSNYLSSTENEQIASDLRCQNKTCSFHTDTPEDSSGI